MWRTRRLVLGLPMLDLTLAVILVATAIVTTVLEQQIVHPATEIVAALAAGSVLFRSRAPLLMAILATTGCVALSLLPAASTPLWAFVTVLVVSFSAAENLTGIRSLVALLLILAGIVVIQFRTSTTLIEMLLTPVAIVGAPALAGWLLARARGQAAQLRKLTEELAEERERTAALAIEAERVRISRELHDILAHTLSTIVVQAGAAQQLLDPGHPIMEPVDNIMASARDALDEVRSLLTLQRTVDPAPQPGIENVPELSAADGAGLTIDGADRPLAKGVSLAAFRIVQEALTNARRHAPSKPVMIRLTYLPKALQLEIENGGTFRTPASSGHGLIGMIERAAAHSGTVTAGPGSDGEGWVVRATLPYESRGVDG